MSRNEEPVRQYSPGSGEERGGAGDGKLTEREEIYARMMSRMQGLFGRQPWIEDVVHTAFESYLAKSGTFRGEGSVESFADSIVLNAARDVMRRQRRTVMLREIFQVRGDWPAIAPAPDVVAEDRDRLRRLNAILERMGPTTRMPYLLHHVEGASVAEIAGIEGATEDAIRKRITRAGRELRERAGKDPVLAEWLGRNEGKGKKGEDEA